MESEFYKNIVQISKVCTKTIILGGGYNVTFYNDKYISRTICVKCEEVKTMLKLKEDIISKELKKYFSKKESHHLIIGLIIGFCFGLFSELIWWLIIGFIIYLGIKVYEAKNG